jgi:tripartite-type tricarboxylate transporter receptor subunit TctC
MQASLEAFRQPVLLTLHFASVSIRWGCGSHSYPRSPLEEVMKMRTALAVVFALIPCVAVTSEYPAKQIRIIVQFTPGTSTDILARLIAAKMGERWNQQVVVDNKPGAGAVLGTDLGAKAAPDIYTLTMAVSSAFGINPTLYSKLPYDAINDFAPIANLGLTPQTLVVNPAESDKTLKDFVAAAKAKPGSVNFASLGSGSTSHLTTEMFAATAGIKLNHVPFKGSAEAHTQIKWGKAVKDTDTKAA